MATTINVIIFAFLLITSQMQKNEIIYEGKYQNLKEWQEFISKIPSYKKKAVEIIKEKLDLSFSNPDKISIKFEDIKPTERNILLATTWHEKDTGKIFIKFRPEVYFNHLIDMEKDIIHEMVHAIFAEKIGDKYSEWPYWIREGMAVWVANQQEEYLRNQLSQVLHFREPVLRMVNGLGDRFFEYQEGVLAFCYLEENFGIQGIKSLTKKLIEGTSYKKALEEITPVQGIPGTGAKLNWLEFKSEVKEYSKKKLKKIIEPFYNDYIKAIALIRIRKYDKAITRFDEILKKHSDKLIVSLATFNKGMCLYNQKRFKRAKEEFMKFLNDPSLTIVNLASCEVAKWKVVTALKELGDKQESSKFFEEFKRDFPHSRFLKK